MRKRLLLLPVVLLAVAVLISFLLLRSALQPPIAGARKTYFRVRQGETARAVLERLEAGKIIRSAQAVELLMRFQSIKGTVRPGVYQIDPTLPGDRVLFHLMNDAPVKRLVLIREGLWLDEVSERLADKDVGKADELLAIMRHPRRNGLSPEFVPKGKTLEGYLFPATYEFTPLMEPKEVVEKMLAAFDKRVYEELGRPSPEKLHKWIVIGSLVELEAMRDEERPIIAGVIYNRLAKKMPLQIDATILYALKERRRLFYRDYGVSNPYNTYKFQGLPPGPICSPGLASIKAAAKPTKHSYLYYVALPTGKHMFAQTYQQHINNIVVSRREFAKAREKSAKKTS